MYNTERYKRLMFTHVEKYHKLPSDWDGGEIRCKKSDKSELQFTESDVEKGDQKDQRRRVGIRGQR